MNETVIIIPVCSASSFEMSSFAASEFLADKLKIPRLATSEADALGELPADEVRHHSGMRCVRARLAFRCARQLTQSFLFDHRDTWMQTSFQRASPCPLARAYTRA